MLACVVAATAVTDSTVYADDMKTIDIGMISSRSGVYQAFGIPAEDGVRLAVSEINRTGFEVGGQHYKLNLIIRDDRSTEVGATTIATEYVRDQNIKFIFGGIGRLAPLIVQITGPEKAIFATASGAAASQFSGKPAGRYLISTLPPIESRARIVAEAMRYYFPNAKSVQRLGPQTADNQAIFPLLPEPLRAKGFSNIPDPIYYQPDTTDFSGILTNLKQSRPDVIFLGQLDPARASAIIKQNDDIQATGGWFAWGLDCNANATAGTKTPYVGFPTVGAMVDTPQTPQAREFVEKMKKMTGTLPPYLYAATYDYDFVFTLVEAMKKSNTVTDTDRIIGALRGLTYNGLVGQITFDAENRAQYGLDACKITSAGVSEVRHFNMSRN